MTGDFDSVIGMAKDEPLNRFLRKIPAGKFEPANGAATLCGLAVETDDQAASPHASARCASAVHSNRRCRIFGFSFLLYLSPRAGRGRPPKKRRR